MDYDINPYIKAESKLILLLRYFIVHSLISLFMIKILFFWL